MDKELKEFLGIEGITKNLSIKKLIKYQLKYTLYFLILGINYLVKKIIKLSDDYSISMSYGVFKTCKKCTFGKSKESLAIVSIEGYSRNDKVLQIMNFYNKNYTNRGSCLGYSNCGKCLTVINTDNIILPCRWKQI